MVGNLIRIAADRFRDLGYLAPDGLLDLAVDERGVRTIRLELPEGQALQLQSIGIDVAGEGDIRGMAEIRASSWQGDPPGDTTVARLLDIDRPSGTVIQTGRDRPAWVEVRLSRGIHLRRVRIRTVADETARHGRGLRVRAQTRWRARTIYDGAAQWDAWAKLVAAGRRDAAGDGLTLALLETLDLTVRGEYGKAHRRLAANVPDEQDRWWFRDAVNEVLLPARGLEWTVHGPQRPFRNWSAEERVDYVRDSAAVTEALQLLTPNTCFGFGSVLAVVRDRALIPHDDDIDLIVGFEPGEAPTLAAALARIEEHLRGQGYEVTGAFAAHRHVRRPGRKKTDVFVGLFEGETVSWYPGARGGLTRSIVFPPRTAELLGVPCPIPAQPEVYLERLYGPGWRVPDPHFSHAWNLSAYADLTGKPGAG